MRPVEVSVILLLFLGVLFMPFSHNFTSQKQQPLTLEQKQKKSEEKKQKLAKKQQQKQQQKMQKVRQLITQNYDGQKLEFMRIVAPSVMRVHAQLQSEYLEVKDALKNGKDIPLIKELQDRYNVTDKNELLLAAKPHPQSIALAQAAIESAWATSRFYEIANNLFGVWSYNSNEPRVAASGSREGQTIWLRKYEDVEESIFHYYQTLSRGFAYEEFRKRNYYSDDLWEITKQLHRYSEKGSEYTDLLKSVIRQNSFTMFDL